MNASRKLRILVVEDEKVWRGRIARLFSEHLVDQAATFEEAKKRIEPGGIPYDVAIVDLNLITPEDQRGGGDMLGGEILLMLRANYPSTIRIALTGSPPWGAMIKGLADKYQVYDFFIKGFVDLHDLRVLVLDSPAAKSVAVEAPAVAPEAERAKAELLDRLRRWAQVRRAPLRQAIEDRQDKLGPAGRARSTEGMGALPENPLKSRRNDPATKLETLDSRCAAVEEMLAKAETAEDVVRAAQEIDRLMGEF